MKRVKFLTGKQHSLLTTIIGTRTIAEVASELDVHPRSLSDWTREKFTLPTVVLDKIKQLYPLLEIPHTEALDTYWYTSEAGRLGANARIKKYGCVNVDENKRKLAWRKWWNEIGKYNPDGCCSPLSIKTPDKSVRLAEFIGIMIGDGGINKRQITITLNSQDDAEYIKIVSNLIYNLFTVIPTVIKSPKSKAVTLLISRVGLVNFLIKNELKQGNKIKNGLNIPVWILKDPEYAKACVRGIMDTDGCIFQETHQIKNKGYSYPRLSIVSASEELLESINDILCRLDFNPKIRYRRVNLESRDDIVRYFSLIGSSNPKHTTRFKKFIGGVA